MYKGKNLLQMVSVSVSLWGVCVCVMSGKGVWVSYITLLYYSLGTKSLTEPGVRLEAKKP